MITAYRICSTKWIAFSFTGEGAKLAGGRWNPVGIPMVYCASSLSLATLEILVHLEDRSVLSRYFSFFEVCIPEEIMLMLDASELPENWEGDTQMTQTQTLGSEWLQTKQSAVLAVPSAVTPGELNYLIDPRHPDFSKIQIGDVRKFSPDPRLTV